MRPECILSKDEIKRRFKRPPIKKSLRPTDDRWGQGDETTTADAPVASTSSAAAASAGEIKTEPSTSSDAAIAAPMAKANDSSEIKMVAEVLGSPKALDNIIHSIMKVVEEHNSSSSSSSDEDKPAISTLVPRYSQDEDTFLATQVSTFQQIFDAVPVGGDWVSQVVTCASKEAPGIDPGINLALLSSDRERFKRVLTAHGDLNKGEMKHL